MDSEVLHSFSRKLGITAGEVVNKAAELERFLDVRGCSLSLNGTAKSVICLEIAANGSHIPVDRVRMNFRVFFLCVNAVDTS